MAAIFPPYDEYQTRTTREIPVVIPAWRNRVIAGHAYSAPYEDLKLKAK